MNIACWLLLPWTASLYASPDLYCRDIGSTSCPLAARIHPRSDSTIVTGSVDNSSVSLNALASSRSTSGERRSSPYFSASAIISFLISVFSLVDDLSSCSIVFLSSLSSFCSAVIFISSSFASWRSLISKIASACRSLILNLFTSAGLGLSLVRIITITSSMLR